MEVKEKAKQLVDKFSPLVTVWDCYHDIPLDELLILKDAKQCALIAVNEILAGIYSVIGTAKWAWKDGEKTQVEYYESVKEEINKL